MPFRPDPKENARVNGSTSGDDKRRRQTMFVLDRRRFPGDETRSLRLIRS